MAARKRGGRATGRGGGSSRRLQPAVVLWLVLVAAMVLTIWWMRDWRHSSTGAPAVGDQAAAGSEVASSDAASTGERRARAEPVAGSRPPDPTSSDRLESEAAVPGPVLGNVPRGDGVRLAIVIDDLGRSVQDARRIFAVDAAISFAILPFETRTREVAQVLESLGAETLLHLPMQASGPQNPGPGALLLEMSAEEVTKRTREALDQVGSVSGVNNHMGSAFSQNESGMRSVLEVLVGRDLFFLDSRTSARSRGFQIARELGIASAERTVFLDNDDSKLAVRAQFERLLDEGRALGAAIAIGHPYPNTIAVLEEEVKAAKQLGYEFVSVSELLERSSSDF